MSEGRDDWAVGDLALCVRLTHPFWPGQVSKRLTLGRMYFVEGVGRPVKRLGGERALILKGCSPKIQGRGWPSTMFVKITPGADIHGKEVEKRHPIPSLMPVDFAVAERSEAEPLRNAA